MDYQQQKLLRKYKQATPIVTPRWDISENASKHNDICEEIRTAGLVLYIATFDNVWSGLFKPSVYGATTLWKNTHDSRKIVRVIDHWQRDIDLSPIFLVKHGREPLGLVADGKHRLTVACHMGCVTLPFMVPVEDSEWVKSAIPSATEIRKLN